MPDVPTTRTDQRFEPRPRTAAQERDSVLDHVGRIMDRLREKADYCDSREHYGSANIFRSQANVLATVYEHVRIRIHHEYTMGYLADD